MTNPSHQESVERALRIYNQDLGEAFPHLGTRDRRRLRRDAMGSALAQGTLGAMVGGYLGQIAGKGVDRVSGDKVEALATKAVGRLGGAGRLLTPILVPRARGVLPSAVAKLGAGLGGTLGGVHGLRKSLEKGLKRVEEHPLPDDGPLSLTEKIQILGEKINHHVQHTEDHIKNLFKRGKPMNKVASDTDIRGLLDMGLNPDAAYSLYKKAISLEGVKNVASSIPGAVSTGANFLRGQIRQNPLLWTGGAAAAGMKVGGRGKDKGKYDYE